MFFTIRTAADAGTRGAVALPGVGKAETDNNDYCILAVVDPTNAITEADANPLNEDNPLGLVGAYRVSATAPQIFVHGGTAADTVTLTYPATSTGMIDLALTGSFAQTYHFAYSSTTTSTQFRIRSHSGDDTIRVASGSPLAARTMLVLGSDGKDSITGGSANDTLVGGAGNDLLVGGAGNNQLVEASVVAATSFTLTNISLAGLGTDKLSLLQSVQLTGGSGNDSLTVSGWTGSGQFIGNGGVDTIIANKNASFTLSNTGLTTTDGMSVSLVGVTKATLTGKVGNDTFQLTGWTGTASLTGGGGINTLVVTRDGDMTLSNSSLVSPDFGNLTLSQINSANLSGGNSANRLLANAFTAGPVTLNGNGGDDVLIGGSKKDQLNGGAGRDILIGGLEADTLNGGSDEDILIGGTSTHSTNVATLNAIMAEWSRTDLDYAARVAKLRDTGVSNGTIKLNSSSVQNDANAADILNGGHSSPTEGLDWFFQSTNDVLDAINGVEIKTAV